MQRMIFPRTVIFSSSRLMFYVTQTYIYAREAVGDIKFQFTSRNACSSVFISRFHRESRVIYIFEIIIGHKMVSLVYRKRGRGAAV